MYWHPVTTCNAEVKDVDALTVIPPVGTRSGRVLVKIRG